MKIVNSKNSPKQVTVFFTQHTVYMWSPWAPAFPRGNNCLELSCDSWVGYVSLFSPWSLRSPDLSICP